MAIPAERFDQERANVSKRDVTSLVRLGDLQTGGVEVEVIIRGPKEDPSLVIDTARRVFAEHGVRAIADLGLGGFHKIGPQPEGVDAGLSPRLRQLSDQSDAEIKARLPLPGDNQ